MKRTYLIIAILIAPFGLLAQRHDNWWIFTVPGLDSFSLDPPYPAVYLNFDTSPPQINYVSCPFFDDVIHLTISDPKGSPLFHSNGYSVFNMDGSVIPNGDGLNSTPLPNWYPFSPPFPMSMMCLPRAGHDGDYYIINLEAGPDNFERRLLMLSLITGATAPGAGIMAFKNKVLFNQGHWLEFLQATKHANGRDWWVVLSDADSAAQQRTFYSFLIGADTAYLANTQQFAGYGPVPAVWNNTTFQRVFSPDGRFLITLDILNGVYIHPFDRCSGRLSPFIRLTFPNFVFGGIAVSPNSRFLYVASHNELWQYDLLVEPIETTKTKIADYDGFVDTFLGGKLSTYFGLPQSGPDGKIYFMSSTYIHYLAKPNKQGPECALIQHGLRMPVNPIGPQYYPNYRLGPLDGSACDTLGLNNEPQADFWWFTDSTLTVEFADNSSYEPAQWYWTFGDGGVSADTSPVHTFPAPGVYTVCLRVSNAYAADTVCKQVRVGATTGAWAPARAETALRVYPNPAGDRVWVQAPGGGGGRLEVFDALGILKKNVPVPEHTQAFEMRVGDLPNGYYFCRLSVQDQIVATAKFAVQR